MKPFLILSLLLPIGALAATALPDTGPAAALRFAESYRGSQFVPDTLHCYPDAHGIPFADTPDIVPMNAALWRPVDVVADFRRRMAALPPGARKKGIIVILKTERCATKASRLCSVTTAALAKKSTPLVDAFAIYGVQLKPRDHDDPPGSLPIETGADAWKNAAAGEYGFRQGPGATLVILNPIDGAKVQASDAFRLRLDQSEFIARQGRTPELERFLQSALRRLEANPRQTPQTAPTVNAANDARKRASVAG